MPDVRRWRTSRTRSCGRYAVRAQRLLTLGLLGAAVCIAPQGQQTATNPMVQQRQQPPYGGLFDDDNVFAHRQLNALNAERQKALVSDTEKLLKLARELNTEIATSNPETLNTGQMRKIASIEKLAHNVKQKMSESMVSGPSLHDPLAPVRQP
jgi:hypothetical protein